MNDKRIIISEFYKNNIERVYYYDDSLCGRYDTSEYNLFLYAFGLNEIIRKIVRLICTLDYNILPKSTYSSELYRIALDIDTRSLEPESEGFLTYRVDFLRLMELIKILIVDCELPDTKIDDILIFYSEDEMARKFCTIKRTVRNHAKKLLGGDEYKFYFYKRKNDSGIKGYHMPESIFNKVYNSINSILPKAS